ncbi:UDP-N-acetylmuramate--L-alanine ligase [bacterium]|nr:UDP-N-acetylmuramate--L-alanine ligase [bacterium]
MLERVRHIHLVGIAGAGMCGIAEVLLNLGFKVSGSDLKENNVTKRLEELGAKISFEHSTKNITNPDVCVYSSAIQESNIELIECKRKSIPLMLRGKMLADLMRLKNGVVVAGSHGKTTITSMIGTILIKAGLDPTIILGGRLSIFGSGTKLGKGDMFVAEMDESDGSFLEVSPTISVISSIDNEHKDFYGNMDKMKDAFLMFANKVPFYGATVFCQDDENIRKIMPFFEKRHISYGLSEESEVRGTNLEFEGFSSSFDVFLKRKRMGEIKIKMPGEYNIRNALAAYAVGNELEIDPEIIRSSLMEFESVDRRFQLRAKFGELLVIEDYAHHPTAIRNVLNASKGGFSRRIIAVCQPHRYTRVKDLMAKFVSCFDDADIVIITEIYSAGEVPLAGVSGKILADKIKKKGHSNIFYIPELDEIPQKICEMIHGDELVIFMGAGDIYEAVNGFIELMNSRIKGE